MIAISLSPTPIGHSQIAPVLGTGVPRLPRAGSPDKTVVVADNRNTDLGVLWNDQRRFADFMSAKLGGERGPAKRGR